MKQSISEFNDFKDLFRISYMKKKEEAVLEKSAKKWWVENFGATFGSTSSRLSDSNGVMAKDKLTWHYSAGMLMFGVPELGDYHYPFIIMMIHFQKWNLKEWKDGYKYGKYCRTSKEELTNHNYRDANPYNNVRFYSNKAWDTGYIMGLDAFKFKI